MNSIRKQETTAPKPILTITALLAALIFPPLLLMWDFEQVWTPLQREYLLTYLATARGGSGSARLLVIDYPDKHKLLADDGDVLPTPAGQAPASGISYTLTKSARSRGAQTLEWIDTEPTDREQLHRQLMHVIYGGQSPWDLTRRAVFFGLVVLLTLPFAAWKDWAELRQLRVGRIRQGPRKVPRFEFNRLKSSTGVGFETTDPPTFPERLAERRELLAKRELGARMVRLARADEEHHILLMGDSGSGKSSLIRQLIPQIRSRGEAAIVYDPSLEFTPQFLDPGRGDLILNPVDARMPYWNPADEVCYAPEAITFARSLFPGRPQDDPEAAGAARSIFGWLLFRDRPTAQQLAVWMSHLDEIDQRIAGTPLADFVSPERGDLRAQVRSLFSRAATGFHLLPQESETTSQWNAAAWSVEREGWLFLPGRPEIRESLRPLMSFWLDSLLIRLLNSREGGSRPVWVILDNLESLQRLPHLPLALTEARKANLRVVIAARSQSGIEARYGEDAETILTGPMTKVLLRTSEAGSAKWASEAIGNVEVEYLRDAEPILAHYGSGRRKFYRLERCVEPLVMDSTIQGLPSLSGYLTSRSLVVPMHFLWTPPQRKQPGFLPRSINQLLPVLKPQPEAALGGGQQVLAIPQPESNNRAPQLRQEKESDRQAIFD